MEALTEIMINVASQSPLIAFLLLVLWTQRNDYEKRIGAKNEVIEKYRERDWSEIDRSRAK